MSQSRWAIKCTEIIEKNTIGNETARYQVKQLYCRRVGGRRWAYRLASALTHLKVTLTTPRRPAALLTTPRALSYISTLKIQVTHVLPTHSRGRAAGTPGVPEKTVGRRRPSTVYIVGSGAGRRRELRRRFANSINKLIKSASEWSRRAADLRTLELPLNWNFRRTGYLANARIVFWSGFTTRRMERLANDRDEIEPDLYEDGVTAGVANIVLHFMSTNVE